MTVPGLAAWLARRGLGAAELEQARGRVARVRAGVDRPPEEELGARGFAVVEGNLGVPGALVRARVDLDRRRVVLDPEGVEDLARRGVGPARACVLAHELFHVLDPGCPARLAELAAHLFATEALGLEVFAGAADLPRPAGSPAGSEGAGRGGAGPFPERGAGEGVSKGGIA